MSLWVYVGIAVAGVVFALATRRGISRRSAGRTPEREGAGSLLWYVFVDWWIGWF
jgi:hypothetical protein